MDVAGPLFSGCGSIPCVALGGWRLPDADAVGGLAVEGALLDVERVVPAVHVGDHAVHALLVHGVGFRPRGIIFSKGEIVDEILIVLRAIFFG